MLSTLGLSPSASTRTGRGDDDDDDLQLRARRGPVPVPVSQSDVRNGLRDVAGAAGSALLSVGKELPWVAPIAFLIGGVVQAAADVHALKGDAAVFARNVQGVERILQEAGEKGTLSAAKEACEALKEVMEEGLAHCHRLQTQYFITSLLLSGRDSEKFKELSHSLQRELQIVAAAASVSAASFMLEEAEQGRKLKVKIEELGGPDAVHNSPEARAQLRGFLKESDQVIVGAIDRVAVDASASRKHLEALTEESRAQHRVMEAQVEKLTTMMQALLKFRAGLNDGEEGGGGAADPEREPPPATQEDLAEKEAAMSGANVKHIMSCLPVPAHEADRLDAVAEAGLDGDNATELVGDEELKALIQEAQADFGVTDTYIGSMDHDSQVAIAHFCKIDDEVREGITGWKWPRDMTTCQHVVAKNDAFQVNGGGDERFSAGGMPNLKMDELATMAAAGHKNMGDVLADLGTVMDESRPDNETIRSKAGKDVSLGAMRNFLGMMSEKETHYTGVPIKINGKTVATFCVLDRHRHRDDIDKTKVEALAARAGEIFTKRAALKKKAKSIAAAAPALFSPSPAAAAASTAATRGEVVQLNVESFADVALDPTLDVAVLLVTTWCQHCAAVKEAWAETARSHAGPNGVPIFATFDVERDDPPTPMRRHAQTWQTTQVPALVLAPRGVNAEPVKFGDITASDVPAALSWMQSLGVVFDVAPRRVPSTPSTPDALTMVTAVRHGDSSSGLSKLGLEDHNTDAKVSSTAIVPAGQAAAHGQRDDAMALVDSAYHSPSSSAEAVNANGFDADLYELAVMGLQQAGRAGVQVLASWAATADSATLVDGTSAEFPAFIQGAMAAQSQATKEHISLASGAEGAHKPPPRRVLMAAVKVQQECHAQQAQLLRTLAGALNSDGSGNGQLRRHSEALMRVSREATERHLHSAMDNLRLAFGQKERPTLNAIGDA